MLPPLFPWLMRDFSLSYTDVGLLTTTFFVISGIGQALAGFVVDRVGALPRAAASASRRWRSPASCSAWRPAIPMLMLTAAFAGVGQQHLSSRGLHAPQSPRRASRDWDTRFRSTAVSGNLGWAVAPVFMAGARERRRVARRRIRRGCASAATVLTIAVAASSRTHGCGRR